MLMIFVNYFKKLMIEFFDLMYLFESLKIISNRESLNKQNESHVIYFKVSLFIV